MRELVLKRPALPDEGIGPERRVAGGASRARGLGDGTAGDVGRYLGNARGEAVERFDVKDISPKATALPFSKLDWLNGMYIRQMAPAELQEHLVPFLAPALGVSEAALRADRRLAELTPLIQERIKVLTDAAPMIDWAFVPAEASTATVISEAPRRAASQ